MGFSGCLSSEDCSPLRCGASSQRAAAALLRQHSCICRQCALVSRAAATRLPRIKKTWRPSSATGHTKVWPQRKEKKTRAAGAGSSTCKPASIYHLNLMHVAPAIRRTANPMGAARMPGAPANGMILALWGSFASTAGGIHTYAERRAARQSSSARTANATTPQVYPLLRRSSSARSPPRPAWPSSSVARA